jgi:hypothetical protein
MTGADAPALSAFYRLHYPRSVFSPWMLEHPFAGIVEDNENVGKTLLGGLHMRGISHAALAINGENRAAQRVYRRLGFSLAECWVQFDSI